MVSSTCRIAALALLLAAAPLAAQGAAPSAGASVQISAPAELLGFRMVDEHRFDVPAQGVRLRYENADARVHFDVFVYPAPRDPSCGGGCDSVAVLNEANGFAQVADVLVQQGRYEKLRVVTNEAREAGGLRGRYVRMVGTQQGEPVTSHAFLLGAGDLLLKTRATYAASAATDSMLHRFVAAYAERMRSAVVPCPSGPTRSEGITMSVDVDTPPSAVAPRVEAALARFGYKLVEPRATGVWRTVPVQTWPDREMWEMFRDRPHPGLEVTVAAEPRGTGTALRISAQVLCASPGNDSATALPLVATMEVMGEFSKDGGKKP